MPDEMTTLATALNQATGHLAEINDKITLSRSIIDAQSTLRHLIRVVVAGMVVTTILAASFLVAQRRASDRLCDGLNNLRQAELGLWLPLLARPSDPLPADATPEQQAAFADAEADKAEFEARLRRQFAPESC